MSRRSSAKPASPKNGKLEKNRLEGRLQKEGI